MKIPLPIARHTPTILNVTLFLSPSVNPAEDSAAALAVADVDDMISRLLSANHSQPDRQRYSIERIDFSNIGV